MTNGIAQVFYYPFESKPLRARKVRNLWKQLAVLRQPLCAYVHQDLSLDSIPKKPTPIHSGNLTAFDKLLPDGDGGFFGGFECREAYQSGIVNADFSFGSKTQSKWNGLDTLPDSALYLSKHTLEEIGWENSEAILNAHLEIADDAGAIVGCVDVGLAEQLLSGMVFQSIVLPKMPFHRWVEQSLWVAQGPEPHRVRGVYWGNYFGSEFCAKLNNVCSGDFLSAYQSQAKYVDGERNGLATRLANGVFVSLSLSPADCFPGIALDYSVQKNMIWLINKLLQARLL